MCLKSFEGDNYVLDQQVVRAALKAYRQLESSPSLTPFMDFLRLIRHRGSLPNLLSGWSNWKTAILVLEWRAAKIVEDRVEAEERRVVDASSDQRVARAVTECYVAKQVASFIDDLPANFSNTSVGVLKSLFTLVSQASRELRVQSS